jgi:Matrixin
MGVIRKFVASSLMAASAASVVLGSYLPAAPGKGEPQGLRWRENVVKLSISNSLVEAGPNIKTDSDVTGAVRRAAAAWERVANIRFEIDFTERSSVSPAGIAGDGISLITIAQTGDNVLLFSKDPEAESAKTRVFYSKRNFITEADIVLNPFQQFSTDGTFGTFDLEATLTHEIGHLLGLRHSVVLGSTMTGSLPKVGTFGTGNIAGRGLSASDEAAIRELYGSREESEQCCVALSGKLSNAAGKAAKGVTIWAEENKTGAVSGVIETAFDGSFRLGGLPAGIYSVFWQKTDDAPSSVGFVGSFNLATGETRLINHKITPERTDLALNYVGVNGRLSDAAISLAGGREYTILLGGKNLDPATFAVEFNSPYLTVRPNSLVEQDFGTGISVVSVNVLVHEDTPPGVYSIFATTSKAAMSSLVGALNIQ